MPLPAPAALDPRLPTGPEALSRVRPEAAHALCSQKHPVCVQLGDSPDAGLARRLLTALEHAYDRLIVGLGLPTPRGDRGLGGNDSLDWYVRSEGEAGLTTALDSPALTHFDSASIWCASNERSSDWERTATLCVAEAIAARLDAALPAAVRRAYAVHLWWVVGGLSDSDLIAVDDFQRSPSQGLFGHQQRSQQDSAGSALWFEYLDTQRGQGIARLSTSLLSLAGNHSEPSSPRFNNEPDIFDVLRASLDNDGARFAELLNDFMIARAFLGTRDDGTHFPELAWSSDFGRIRFDWSLPWSSLPRRVALTRPLYPTGSVYIWVDLDGVALGDTLGFQAQWEPPVSFAWSLVRVDKDGRELSRLHVPYQQRGTQVEQRLVNLESAAGVLIVGTNLGGVDLAHPFDPDLGPFEPHSALVYLVRL